MIDRRVTVESLRVYSPADAAGLGRLMPFLSQRLSDRPVDEALLRAIIKSPYHEQLVARLDGRIVGAATLSLLLGPGVGRQAYLEDFVTDPGIRGQGVGGALWQAVLAWCRQRGAALEFTSHRSRTAAHRFYEQQGARVRDTTVFHVSTDQD